MLSPYANLKLQSADDIAAVSLPGDPQRNPELSQTPNYHPGGVGETWSFHQNASLNPS